MSLQDYKLFYEKVVDGNKTIYASTSGVPSGGDTKLTYKLNDGTTITDAQINDNYHYFYEKLSQIIFGSTSRTQVPSISDAQINVFVGTDVIFGTPFYSITVAETTATIVLKDGDTTITSGSSVAKGQTISGTVTFNEGYEVDTHTIKVGSADATTLTIDGNGKFSFIVSDTTIITITEKQTQNDNQES